MEQVYRFYSEDLYVRAAAVISTPVVRDLAKRQKMGPLATMATGRAITGSLLMASVLRDRQVIGLHFKGDGALGSVYAEASYEGEARGWCDQPLAELPLREGHLDVAGGVGRGFLHVTRSQPFEKSPHVSSVELVSGEIGDDLAYYLHQSLQIPSVIALGAILDAQKTVQASGGVVIELMPGAPESTVSNLEKAVAAARPLSHLLKEGCTAEQILRNLVGPMKMTMIAHEHPISYRCRCSMDRVERSLTLVGKEELKSLVSDGKDIDVRCEFCGQGYNVTLQRLKQLLTEFSTAH